MNLYFAPDAKLIVEASPSAVSSTAGGKLTLSNNTLLTVDPRCGTNGMWEGIEVRGYSNQSQSSSGFTRQASLTVNAAIIENAKTGVYVGARNSSNQYISDTGGGIVIMNNSSVLRKNGSSVIFQNYSNGNNISIFIRTVFENNIAILDPTQAQDFYIAIVVNNGIKFESCIFRNTVSLPAYNLRKTGILTYNSTFSVLPRCLDVNCNTFIQSQFVNLSTGIEAYGIFAQNFPFTVDRTYFDNNWRGILTNVHNPIIIRNNFELFPQTLTTAGLESYGVYLSASTGYTVEENNFSAKGTFNASRRTIGVLVHNSGTANNRIYNNTFSKLRIGGQAQLTNAQTTLSTRNSGLQWLCNYFTPNQMGLNDILLPANSRIRYCQGDCLFTIKPAGNHFSKTINSFSLTSSTQEFFYYHNTGFNYIPSFNVLSPPIINLVNTNIAYTVALCPDNYGNGNLLLASGNDNFYNELNDNLIVELSSEDANEEAIYQQLFDNALSAGNMESANEYLAALNEKLEDEELKTFYNFVFNKVSEVGTQNILNAISLDELNAFNFKEHSMAYTKLYFAKRALDPSLRFTEYIQRTNDETSDKSHKNGKAGSAKDEMLAESNSITVAPNPTADVLYINISIDENLNFEVIDITGKVVLSGSVNQSNSTIAMNRLNSGVYFVKIFSKEEIKYEGKVVKL